MSTHCNSIEEASVDTTIQSVAMDEIGKNPGCSYPNVNANNNNCQLSLGRSKSVGGDGDLVSVMKGAGSMRQFPNNATASFGENDGNSNPSSSSPSSSSSQTPSHANLHSDSIARCNNYPPSARKVLLRLTPEEEQLFQLLVDAAEAHERGTLLIDPNPPQHSVSARGGFTKEESSAEKDASWMKPPPRVSRIEIRIAGGWVRDKLLKQHSSDVDVALDCMMGVQFARIVQSYLAQRQTEEEEKEQVANMVIDEVAEDTKNVNCSENSDDNSQKVADNNQHKNKKSKNKNKNKQPKIGVIGANPSQSKHLETATMNINGIDVDFVNLRAEEVYEANSRIPTSRTRMFGTPLEDALRRDFTINSLFYNIRTRKIEDWTGRGLNDLLEYRRIVTPVDAHETFHDDPLRVLRAIRFCVRLDFALDDNIREAAMSKRVHHSLHVKVSRERVGKELEGMLSGKGARPGRALDLIAELHLAGSVFCFPGSFPGDNDFAEGGPVTGKILDVQYHGCCGRDGLEAVELAAKHRAMGWEESSKLLALLPRVMEGHVDEREKIIQERKNRSEDYVRLKVPSPADMRLVHLCSFILPFHNLTFPDAKGRETTVTSHMIKEALKLPTRDIMAVALILRHVDEMVEILSEMRSKIIENSDNYDAKRYLPCRLRSGMIMRSLKDHWVTCLLTAAVWEARSLERLHGTLDNLKHVFGTVPPEQPSREFYRAVVEDLNLDEIWRVRPLLDGKAIIKELDLPKGPLVGVYLDDQTRWMLLNPTGTKEDCVVHLHERKRAREQEICAETAQGKDNMVVDDQNELTVGIANSEGHSSPIGGDAVWSNGTKHLSKKIRAENSINL
mmetsp:Transcript_3723/g.7861  ORF Transcript_3723/g.7861 Transcript_3723/m.7861 type:complete len:845 (-) Transcript_3723:27-2561(-)